MAGTQGTQGTRGTGYIPEAPAPSEPQPFVPRNAYLPPLRPLTLNKDQLDYRTELLKGITKLREDDQAWHEGLMDTWSTHKIALAGLDAKLTMALISNAGQGYIADAMRDQAYAAAMRLKADYIEHASKTDFYKPDEDAVKKYITGLGDADTGLINSVHGTEGQDRLNAIEAEAAKQATPELQREARKKGITAFLNEQTKIDATEQHVNLEIGKLPDTTKYDTLLDIAMKKKEGVQKALGDDERFAEFLPEYFEGVDGRLIAAAKITDDQIKAGNERHDMARKIDEDYERRLDELSANGFSLPPATRQAVKDTIKQYHDSLSGDPLALHNLLISVPTPPELQAGIEQYERELQRQDIGGAPNADRDNFIKAFNQRAGSNNAFYAWSVAMGFRGGRSTDRAAAFAAQYPEISKPFTDAVKADPTLLDVANGYQPLKAKLKELSAPVGVTGPYRVFHPPKSQTPGPSIDPKLPGTGMPEGAPARPDLAGPPVAAPVAAEVAPGSSSAPSGMSGVPAVQTGPDAATFAVPEAASSLERAAVPTSVPPSPVSAPAAAAPAAVAAPVEAPPPIPGYVPPIVDQYTARNRVESRPDGSVVIVRPDGTEMLVSGPSSTVTLSQPAAPAPPAPRVLDLGEESITVPRELPSVSSTIGARFSPVQAAVAPSSIPGSSDFSPAEERALMLRAIREKYGMQLDANGQPVPVGGE